MLPVGCDSIWCVSLAPQACTLLLTVLFVYDVFFVFITPFLTNVREDSFVSCVMCLVERCLSNVCHTDSVFLCDSTERGEYNGGGSGWSLWLCPSWEGGLGYKFHNSLLQLRGRWRWCLCLLQLPMVLKVPRLNSSPLALCDRPFSLLGFGDILVPGN